LSACHAAEGATRTLIYPINSDEAHDFKFGNLFFYHAFSGKSASHVFDLLVARLCIAAGLLTLPHLEGAGRQSMRLPLMKATN
jgi:hypothetical protein